MWIRCPGRLLPAALAGLLLISQGTQAGSSDRSALEALRRRLEANAYDEVLAGARALVAGTEDDPLLTAEILDLMVETLRRAGRASDPEGRKLAERAIDLKGRAAGSGDPAVAESESQLGMLLSHAGELDEAAAAHRRALAIYEKAYGPVHPKVAKSLDNLADVLQKQAAFAEALADYQRALAINEAVHGFGALPVADTLYDMGNLAVRTGDYAAARERYQRALGIYTARREPGHLDISMTKITLGYLMELTGDLSRARVLLEEAAAECAGSVGAEHPLTLTALANLGTVLYAMEDFEAARPVFARVLAIRERILGPSHADTADAALNLGAALRETGRGAEAIPLYQRALAVYREKLGPEHPRVAELQANLGNARMDGGRLEAATALYRSSLEIRLAALGRSHPDTARSHELLAGALLAGRKRASALEHATEAAAVLERHTRETVAFLPEREALLMTAGRSRPEALLFRGLVDADADRAAWLRACWTWALGSRALVLDELAGRNRAVLAKGGGAARGAWEKLAAARQAVADLWVQGPEGTRGSFEEALSRVRSRKEQAEQALARLSAEYGRERRAEAAGIDEVAAALPGGAALVEYVKVATGLPTDGARPERYFALIVDGEGSLRSADLGPAEEIDGRVAAWREALASSGRAIARGDRKEGILKEALEAGAILRATIWDPAAAQIGSPDLVFIVPDGLIHNVDFNALPLEDGGYLVEGKTAIHLLESGRDLVRLGPPAEGGARENGGTLILGAPEFGGAADGMESRGGRGGPAGCDPSGGGRWSELPESAREVDAIGRLLEEGGASVRLLIGADATEARLKAEAPGKRILHLATHGFFLHGRCEEGEAAGNPLLLSGLVLAGANQKPPPTGEDGYLTSEELAAMDLRGLSLAVLSACDTGRGRIASGEGVLGLRRSLALAGARTTVMSLWRVPDREARRWMISFHEARAGGTPVREAVRQANLAGLARLRARGIPPHPYLWAGFVASGDWR